MSFNLFVLLFLFSHQIIANDFRFEPQKLEDFQEYKSFEDEVIIIGGKKIKRSTLVVNETRISKTHSSVFQEYFRSRNGRASVNAAIIGAFTYTFFRAAKDKQKHAIAGALVGYGTTKICEMIFDSESDDLICALTGAGAALLIGIAKEAYDSTGRGNVDFMDAVYTFVPGALISFKVSF